MDEVTESIQSVQKKIKASSWFDTASHYWKRSLPHIARLMLVSTYFEDGIRMWLDWHPQRRYMENEWSCGWYLATLFVVFNLFGQLASAVLVLCQRQVTVACGVLLAVTSVQTIFYRSLWNFHFFMRNLAATGGIILLMADVKREGKRLFAGLPTADSKSHKPYVLLSGRILLTLMFLTILRVEADITSIILDCVGLLFIVLIAVGYMTHIASIVLAVWLMIVNFYANTWFMLPEEDMSQRDFLKYYFFQTLSMCGGLLLLVALGPGGFSIDKRHKQL